MLNGSHTAVAGSSLVNSATGAAGALAGWAIASLGKQLPVSEHSAISATPAQVQQPLYAQQSSSDSFQPTSNLPSRSNTPSQSRVPARKMGAMQLGGTSGGRASAHKPGMSSTSLVDELAGEFEEDGDEVANAWGSSDLMDVNADGDDWSECVREGGNLQLTVLSGAFEEAPVPLGHNRNPTRSSHGTKQESMPGMHSPRRTVTNAHLGPQTIPGQNPFPSCRNPQNQSLPPLLPRNRFDRSKCHHLPHHQRTTDGARRRIRIGKMAGIKLRPMISRLRL